MSCLVVPGIVLSLVELNMLLPGMLLKVLSLLFTLYLVGADDQDHVDRPTTLHTSYAKQDLMRLMFRRVHLEHFADAGAFVMKQQQIRQLTRNYISKVFCWRPA